jgi:N-sulfoglucosamine sulfohydrolase
MKCKICLGLIVITLLPVSCRIQTNGRGPENGRTVNFPDPGFRPNILWITCEDITPALGCYGDPVAETPNLDRLAEEGVRYTHAFSVSGVCAPSRHALITGMYPTSTGGHNMRTLNVDRPDIPDYSVILPPGVKCFSEYLRASGYYCTNNRKTDYQFEPPLTAWDESSGRADWRDRRPGQPFFAVINFMITHESRIWMKYEDPLRVSEQAVALPPYYPEHPVIRRDVARKYSNIAELDQLVGQLLARLEEDGLMDSTIIFFYSDHGGPLPRQKRELYDSGLRVPLLIRFPGKHLAGQVTDELVSFVDFGPTVLSLAGISVPEHMQGRPFLGNQKAGPRKYIFAARDRMDSEYDRVRAVRDKRFKYFYNYHPELPYVQNIEYRKQMPMMRVLYEYDSLGKFTGVQKLWWRKTKPVEELYDTEKDPYEFNNLAGDPAFSEKLEEMREAMKEWQETYGDKGAIPEAELIRSMWMGKDGPPSTRKVEARWTGDSLTLSCPTEGASIAWQYESDSAGGHWNLYTDPLLVPPDTSIRALAVRIGYRQGPVSLFRRPR